MVIDYLEQAFPESDVGIAYIYFDYKQTWRIEQLLRSVLANLIRSASTTSLPRQLVELYEQYEQKKLEPKVNAISKLLASESCRFSKVFVVIDAIDECLPDTIREDFFDALDLVGSMLRLMIVGRRNIDVLERYPLAKQLMIQAEAEDMKKYLEQQIKSMKRYLDSNLTLQKIQDTIIKKAAGM